MMPGDVPGGASRGPKGQAPRHIPVLLSEVVAGLEPRAGELVIDATFGAGGYTRAILEAAPCRVIAFDRDQNAIRDGQLLVSEFSDRLQLVNRPFSEMEEGAREAADVASGPFVDGVVLDIGVSSMQIDDPERGFSFQHDGPLDMRMGGEGESAADFLNSADETAIANVIYNYGEERRSRAIARAIVAARKASPITRTSELADIVSRVFGGRKIDGRHPATRTFQALRIHINDELGELVTALADAEKILKPGGRLAVVTFHSLEDRIVKRFLAERSGKTARVSRHLPEQPVESEQSSFQIVNRRPLTPCQGELDVNPRARSARLRVAIRTEGPARPLDRKTLALPTPQI